MENKIKLSEKEILNHLNNGATLIQEQEKYFKKESKVIFRLKKEGSLNKKVKLDIESELFKKLIVKKLTNIVEYEIIK